MNHVQSTQGQCADLFLLASKTCLDLMNEDMHALPGDVEAVLKESTWAREHKVASNHS